MSIRTRCSALVAGDDSPLDVVDQTTREVVRLRTNEGHSGWILG
jgi:hypothetical protein